MLSDRCAGWWHAVLMHGLDVGVSEGDVDDFGEEPIGA